MDYDRKPGARRELRACPSDWASKLSWTWTRKRAKHESEKTIDFRRWLKGPVFEPLKDLKYFRRFFLDGWTIAWTNGADIAPEALYEYVEISNERGAA